MPRLNVIEPKDATGKAKQLWEGPLKGKHLNIFKGLANSGAAFNAYVQFSGALKEGQLSDAEREVIALAMGELNNCDYCLAAHTMVAKGAGLDADTVLKIRQGEPDDPKHQALVTLTHRLAEGRGWVEEADLEAFKQAGYDDGAIVEVVAAVALNTFTNYFNHLNETEVDLPRAPALA